MKNILKTLAVIICASFTLCFTQCTKSPENLIIGSWVLEYEDTTTTQDGETVIDHKTPEEGEQVVMTFNKDLSMVIEETEVENGSTQVTTTRGTYLITDNKITINSEIDGQSTSITYDIDYIDKHELTLSLFESGSYGIHTYSVSVKIQFKRK